MEQGATPFYPALPRGSVQESTNMKNKNQLKSNERL